MQRNSRSFHHLRKSQVCLQLYSRSHERSLLWISPKVEHDDQYSPSYRRRSLIRSRRRALSEKTFRQLNLPQGFKRRRINQMWWLLFVRAWSLLVVRSIDCCRCPEPSCLSVERLSFIEAWVITALWPKCSCCLVFSYVLCIVCAGCFCRTTIIMTIFWSLVCWNSIL